MSSFVHWFIYVSQPAPIHRGFTFHVSCLIFYVLLILLGFGLSRAHAQTRQQSGEQLEADLPEVIRAEIIDTTRIVLEPRSRFNDPSAPQLVHAIALYAKERLWNLPPIVTPQKAVKPEPPPPKNYTVHLTAYPSLPASLFYQVLFAGHLEQMRGFLHLKRRQLRDARTKERGDYNLDGFRGGGSHQYQELSEISFDLGLHLKTLEWLPSPVEGIKGGSPNPQKDLLLFRSDLNWKQQISETTWSTLNLDTALLRLEHGEFDLQDGATDLRLNFDMVISWPFLNPIHTGGHVEYFSATATDERFNRDIWATIFRLYVRDQFTSFGPFVLSTEAEGVSLRERDDAGKDKTRLQLNPSFALTTNLHKRWLIQLEGMRTTSRPGLSSLYFDTDYISLNPFLRPEKTWNGGILLKYHQGGKFEVNLSGFAKRIDDLAVLTSQEEHFDKTGVKPSAEIGAERTWTPTNIDASIYGGQLHFSARIIDRLDLRFQYIHEVHKPEVGEQIPYRPTDLIDLDLVYHLPTDFRVTLGAEFQGAKHVDGTTDETLGSYLLLKPKLSKTIGNYVDAFVGGAFAIGDYLLLQGYELSQGNFDFGIELRF